MAHIRRENKAEPVKEIAIFAICSPVDNQVFIWKTLNKNLRNTYKDHFNLYCAKTKPMFERSKNEGKQPPIYLLDVVLTVHRTAFNHCVVWTKYFQENGYEVISNKDLTSYTEELSASQTVLFEKIKDTPIDAICSPDKNLFPNYGRVRKRKNTDVKSVISIPVKEEEYILIQAEAKKNSKSMAAFCRERILTGNTIHIDFGFAMEFFNEMMEDRELLRQIMYAIYSRGSYLPVDMENIQNLVDDILKNAKEIDKSFKAQVKSLKQSELGNEKKK